MKHIVALTAFLVAVLGVTAAPQAPCHEAGFICVIDPTEPGEGIPTVEFCSRCCHGWVPAEAVNTGVSSGIFAKSSPDTFSQIGLPLRVH